MEAMDWTPEDVYGWDDLDHMSLVRLMRDQKVIAITDDAVILRGANGLLSYIYRRAGG